MGVLRVGIDWGGDLTEASEQVRDGVSCHHLKVDDLFGNSLGVSVSHVVAAVEDHCELGVEAGTDRVDVDTEVWGDVVLEEQETSFVFSDGAGERCSGVVNTWNHLIDVIGSDVRVMQHSWVEEHGVGDVGSWDWAVCSLDIACVDQVVQLVVSQEAVEVVTPSRDILWSLQGWLER
ncbi:hypothetical protein BCR33DRAFT_475091 [Rhizoclosmatium globosum]|uniref:Uncharacterized protein n=1 Tax=Rhizoclosmatium globosum TaxID=329046 RepID=A0A1Y2BPK6_9FUNG|nr:hypothetical protein BCR33DRAFT_475091 [Rhizoclosmatium globosum]|eukprot:ORY36684.1 hypothetical protein BCR33DRAFT_475091 [Rhizoclosmatium globosum]